MHSAAFMPLHGDQADGLRRLFAHRRARFVALAHNPELAHGGVVIERLTAAWALRGLHTLVVDASDAARAPQELARLELGACIERLSPEVSFLAARGLPLRYADARGSTAGFLQAVVDAVPEADVVLVNASAAELARLFHQRALRPLLLADGGGQAITEAYAAAKLLMQRAGMMVFDLIVALPPAHPVAPQVAQRLADCVDHFLGAAMHDWAAVAPDEDPAAPLTQPLLRLALALLNTADAGGLPPVPMGLAGRSAPAWRA